MRYIKVLVLAVFLFLALIFFFQNQAPLSQEMELTLNLFFIPAMSSIKLPFYFIVIAAFFIGCILSWLLLIWDRFIISSKYMKAKWKITELERKAAKLQGLVDAAEKSTTARALPPAPTAADVDLSKKEAHSEAAE